ncbi:hypothetical protein C8A00DRAFT_45705 [Chaetomidium leptoderma]|uniref:FAD-binding domain-containing protein n=1 Tax=Chaetomidium leptoderma TaxID=669021 RepID=A0AAN6VGG9_9PEZI|nr:hypothetical protein C8A00DRAFT_45705 [Chaetomidium leptoderma]
MTASEGSSAPKVAIVGAGLTGLLTAHGLKKNGFDVVVFERALHITDRLRDWTILIHWAMPLFKKLLPEHLVEKLPEALCNPGLDFNEEAESLPVYNGETGKLLFSNRVPGARRVSRHRLRALLAKDLDDAGVIRWGKRLAEFSQNSGPGPVQLRFEDGSTFDADYVLGADGSSSKVRELLFNGDEAARVGLSGFMFATAISQWAAAEVIMHAGTPNDLSQWTTMWIKIWRKDVTAVPEGVSVGQEALDYLRATTKNLAEPFQSFIDWTADGSECYIDEMKYWVSRPFDNRGGGVTLAGDAGHPMLIYRGQGFQHAILDASQYLDALIKVSEGAGTREQSVSAYDADMIERGAKAVSQSLQEAEFSMDPKTVTKMLMARQGHGSDNPPSMPDEPKNPVGSATDSANTIANVNASAMPETNVPRRDPSPAPQQQQPSRSPTRSPHDKDDAVLHDADDQRQGRQQQNPGIVAAGSDHIEDEDEFALTDGYETGSTTGSTSVTSSIYAHTCATASCSMRPLAITRTKFSTLERALVSVWAIEIGDQFPNARVRGIDLSPTQPVWVPPNVDFLVDDCEQGEWLDQDADFVHLRFMTIVLKDVPGVLRRAHESLKPGGWIELQELCAEILCDDGSMPDNDPVKYMYELGHRAFTKFGMDVTLPKILEPLLLDAGFENVQCVVKKVPIGPWARDKTLRVIGMYQKMAVQDLMPILPGRPFTALGMSPIESQVTLAHARQGLGNSSVHRYFHYYFWFAQKPSR